MCTFKCQWLCQIQDVRGNDEIEHTGSVRARVLVSGRWSSHQHAGSVYVVKCEGCMTAAGDDNGDEARRANQLFIIV
jgi:hypothetical protein